MKFIPTSIIPAVNWFAHFQSKADDDTILKIPLVCWALGNIYEASEIVQSGVIHGMVADENGQILIAKDVGVFLNFEYGEEAEYDIETVFLN